MIFDACLWGGRHQNPRGPGARGRGAAGSPAHVNMHLDMHLCLVAVSALYDWIMAQQQRKATILPVDRDLSEDELTALKPMVRQLIVLRLEDVYRDACASCELAAQFSERGPDPRWAELKIRSLLGIARIMGVDRGLEVEQHPNPDAASGPSAAELRDRALAVLAGLEAGQRTPSAG